MPISDCWQFQKGVFILQSLPQTNGVGDLHEPSPEPSADHDNVSYCKLSKPIVHNTLTHTYVNVTSRSWLD